MSDTAIEALRYSEFPNSSDCISRQAAIDALCAVCGKACDKSKFVYNAPQDEQVILCPEHYCLCTLPSAQPVQWIPCSERLPEEDHWLGGSGRQFSDEVMVSVANYDDEDMWNDICKSNGACGSSHKNWKETDCEVKAWIHSNEQKSY